MDRLAPPAAKVGDTRIVHRGVGYEIVAVPMKANAKGEGYQGYQPTRGKDNGGRVRGKSQWERERATKWKCSDGERRGRGNAEKARGSGAEAATRLQGQALSRAKAMTGRAKAISQLSEYMCRAQSS